ncbi:MAG: molybdopterin molybdotransferase MoeA, partial [Planctomycetota bacterium]
DQIAKGANIRRRGENSLAGDTIIAKGTYVDSAAIAALASFGTPRVSVLNKVRIAILNTGDELAQPGEPVEDWQIRDSNGPTLKAWLAQLPWAEVTEVQHVGDTLEQVQATLKEQLQRVDAIILTGGVSMGDTDYVPKAVESIGGEIHFHRLPLRPGRPVLGAARDGKLILGLPGNPVSVAVTSRVIGLPLLRKMAGLKPILVTPPEVTLEESDDRSLHLVWYRLVEAGADGKLRLAASKGSGDLVSLARSVGFVRLPAGDSGCGPWPFYAWE